MIKEEIRELLHMLTIKMRKSYTEQFRSLGIHVGQEMALCKLWERDGISQTELRRQMGCEASTLSNMLRKLEQDGIVYRKQDKQDARSSNVFLTDKGKQLQKPVQKIWQKQQAKMLNGILQEELLLTRRILQQMVENVKID